MTLETNEYDVIRKVVDRKASYVGVTNAGNECSSVGKLFKVAECLPNFCGESPCYLAAAFSVPGDYFTQFAPRTLAKANGFQRDNTSR